MNKITMDDIAKMAKVSKSTVSRALSHDPRVNVDTREKIADIARDLNYRPHQVAQALAKKNTNIIGVIIPFAPRSVADPFFLEFLQGIGEVAADEGYSLALPNIGLDQSDDMITVINRNNVDGVILTEPYLHDFRIEYLTEKEIPFVFLGNPMSEQDICWVEVDNETGAYQAVNYLIEAGHRKIATIAGNPEMVSGKYRLEGYKRALREQGISINPELIYYADFTRKGAVQATQDLLRNKSKYTAVFAANDLMAMAVIRTLKEAGVAVPGEVAVLGYDGIQIGEFIDPPLSTIKLPSIRMGRVAMTMLSKLIKKEEIEKRQVSLAPRLLLRSST